MKTSRELLLEEIEAHLDQSGMTPVKFGQVVLNDGGFVQRLREGKSGSFATADAVRLYIHEYNARPKKANKRRRGLEQVSV